MKEMWECPKITVQQFVPNEYVAACGDGHTTYLFECNANEGNLYYYPNGRESGKSNKVGYYWPCGSKHEVSSTDAFYDGFVDYNYNRKEDDGEAVIVWLEPVFLGVSGHATTELDKNSWVTSKS